MAETKKTGTPKMEDKVKAVKSISVIPKDDTGKELSSTIMAVNGGPFGQKITSYKAEWVHANPVLAIKANPNLAVHTDADADVIDFIRKANRQVLRKILK